MKICFYPAFKPIDHRLPSGDLVTAAGIFDYFHRRGHELALPSRLRCRWIYWRPWLWPLLVRDRRRIGRRFADRGCDLWFSYHSYYKAPDLLGPGAAGDLGIPYVLFQGIFSTKVRRRWTSLPGYHLNRRVLLAARHVFTNKRRDLHNLRRLLPEERLTYVAPGLHPEQFAFSAAARDELRSRWRVGEEPVVLSVAMFRPGVKAEGLTWVIRACGALARRGRRFTLVLVGDGKARPALERLATAELPGRVRFTGQVARGDLFRYYSAADLFVFPGFQEALGMVYLEAQSCGVPAVAFDNAGTPEAIRHGVTGLLAPLGDADAFQAAIDRLLADSGLRRHLGENARACIRESHDLDRNYAGMEAVLHRVVAASHREGRRP
jgi:glycosyltransferase involved in cell wall biosynthesis